MDSRAIVTTAPRRRRHRPREARGLSDGRVDAIDATTRQPVRRVPSPRRHRADFYTVTNGVVRSMRIVGQPELRQLRVGRRGMYAEMKLPLQVPLPPAYGTNAKRMFGVLADALHQGQVERTGNPSA